MIPDPPTLFDWIACELRSLGWDVTTEELSGGTTRTKATDAISTLYLRVTECGIEIDATDVWPHTAPKLYDIAQRGAKKCSDIAYVVDAAGNTKTYTPNPHETKHAAPSEDKPRVFSAGQLRQAEQPRWLAKGRLPRSAVSILVGDEGIGKSLLWVWIVAAVTTGKPLPGFGIPARDPGHVLIVITEDDWSTTVLPRLQVAEADLTQVSVICTEEDGSGAPVFPRDIDLVTSFEPNPALVVVDAWLDTVPGKMSVKDPQQARQALHPWKEAATKTDAAVLLLTHTNRVDSGNARDKYGATGELRKKARMTLFAQQDDDGNLLVGPEKSNTTGKLPASKFAIKPVQVFRQTEDHDGTIPLLEYLGDSEQTAREHIEQRAADNGGESTSSTERDRAKAWLREYLKAGPVDSGDAKRDADAAGFSTRTLQRARTSLQVIIASEGRKSLWSLPSVPPDAGLYNPDTGGTRGTGSKSPVQDMFVTVPTVPATDPCHVPSNGASLGTNDDDLETIEAEWHQIAAHSPKGQQ